MEIMINRTRLSLIQGDITNQATDAIVNAANSTLMGGGGVDGAIHRAGGPEILEECKAIRARMCTTLPTGQAVITTGGNLKARWVIHTVGPVWQGGTHGEPESLANAYRNSLKLAVERGLRTVSFPSISTGAYGYPMDKAADIALTTVVDFLNKDTSLRQVVFVLFGESALSAYGKALKNILSEPEQSQTPGQAK